MLIQLISTLNYITLILDLSNQIEIENSCHQLNLSFVSLVLLYKIFETYI